MVFSSLPSLLSSLFFFSITTITPLHLDLLFFLCAAVGAAYGTAKSGVGIAGIGTFRPDLVMKALIPVVMAGIIAIYGLVVSVLISGSSKTPTLSIKNCISIVKLTSLLLSPPLSSLLLLPCSG